MIQEYIDVWLYFEADIVKALFETLNMLSISLVVSLILGLLLGFSLFVFRKDGIFENTVLYFILSTVVNVVRSIPFILFIIAFIPLNRLLIGTGFGVNASKVPLSIIGVALFARLVEQDLLDVNRVMYETSYAMGATKLQYFKNFLLVEARSGLVLSFTSVAVSLLSYSTVMGIIGGGGLGYLAMAEGYHNFNYKLMWLIILLMIVLVQFVQSIGNRLAQKIDYR